MAKMTKTIAFTLKNGLKCNATIGLGSCYTITGLGCHVGYMSNFTGVYTAPDLPKNAYGEIDRKALAKLMQEVDKDEFTEKLLTWLNELALGAFDDNYRKSHLIISANASSLREGGYYRAGTALPENTAGLIALLELRGNEKYGTVVRTPFTENRAHPADLDASVTAIWIPKGTKTKSTPELWNKVA